MNSSRERPAQRGGDAVHRYSRLVAQWIVIALLLAALGNLFWRSSSQPPGPTVAFRDVLDDVGRGQITDVTLPGHSITGHFKDGRTFNTYAPADSGLFDRLRSRGVNVMIAPPDEGRQPTLLTIAVTWLPMLLLIGVWIFFMHQMRARRPTEDRDRVILGRSGNVMRRAGFTVA